MRNPDRLRLQLVHDWEKIVVGNIMTGALTGKPVNVKSTVIPGPRAAVILLSTGMNANSLMKSLNKSDCANLRQFVPWRFAGKPQVFMDERWLRLEVGWPRGAEKSLIRLTDLNGRPTLGPGQWFVGQAENGSPIRPGLSDKTPHWLCAGTTGAGKSVAMKGAILQLCEDTNNQFVLIDGKGGESLTGVQHLQGVVGPAATEGPQMRAALGWVVKEMMERYQQIIAGNTPRGRIVVIVDEIQEMVEDKTIVNLLRKLMAQGRSAKISCILSTQHPSVKTFGHESIKRNLSGRIALHVLDADASKVAVGSTSPRADKLLGAGDAYTIGPGVCHRTQVCYVDSAELDAAPTGQWRFTRWPDFDAESIGQGIPNTKWFPASDQMAVARVAAAEGEGRDAMIKRMKQEDVEGVGSTRGRWLIKYAKDMDEWHRAHGYSLCQVTKSVPDPTNVQIVPHVWG